MIPGTNPQTKTGFTFQAVLVFKCNADAVRHVKWSPKDAFTVEVGGSLWENEMTGRRIL